LKSIEIPKKSTRVVTFRLPIDRSDQLRKLSESRDISSNVFVNQILKAHLDWHRSAANAKLYYLPKAFLIRLLNELDEEELNRIARETAKNDLVDISLFFKGGFSIASISEIAETWLRIAQMPYRFEFNENSCRIVIEHDMGLKYSYLIREISRYLLEVAFESNSSCSITENLLYIVMCRVHRRYRLYIIEMVGKLKSTHEGREKG
jgi:hypothetical protein